MAFATTMPVNAATDPTERSMCPMMMTITMPIARIRMYEYWLTTLMRFPEDSVSPVPLKIHVSTWKTTRMTTRLPRMPN